MRWRRAAARVLWLLGLRIRFQWWTPGNVTWVVSRRFPGAPYDPPVMPRYISDALGEHQPE